MVAAPPRTDEVPEVEILGDEMVIRVKGPVTGDHQRADKAQEPLERKVRLPKTKWA